MMQNLRKPSLWIVVVCALTLVLVGCAPRDICDLPGPHDTSDSGLTQDSYSTGSNRDDGINESYTADADDIVTDPETGSSYVEGMLLVYFVPSASQEARDSAVAQVGGEVVGRMDAFDEYQVRVQSEDKKSLEALRLQLEGDSNVDFVTLDYVTTVGASYTNDPWSGAGMNDSDGSWWSLAIDAPYAWDCYAYNDMADVPVAVIDCGFDMDHTDLEGRLVRASDNDMPYRDEQSHGTHVAGIIAAEPNNYTCIAGINWKGNVLCFDAAYVNSSGRNSFPTSAIEQGLYDCVHAGAKVINCSFGSSEYRAASEWPSHLDDVNAAARRCSREIGSLLSLGYDFLVVQSAGNGDSSSAGVDAIYNLNFASITYGNCDTNYASATDIIDHVLIVAAAERAGGSSYQLTSFSNWGSQVSVCAPGSNILSTVVGDGCDTKNGTSMAAPIVSGIAALTWSANPALSGPEVKQIVTSSAYAFASPWPGASGDTGSYPLVNAEKAVTAALERAGKTSEPPANNPSDSDARKALEVYIREELEFATVGDGVMMVQTDDETVDTYYQFAVGDFDGDGLEELFCSHEATGTYGNSYGCLNDIYAYDPATDGVGLQWRSITTSVPMSLVFYDSGYIRMDFSGSQDGLAYMPVDAARAAVFGLENGNASYLHFSKQSDGWHLTPCAAFYAERDQLLTDSEYAQCMATIEGTGQLGFPVQAMEFSAIDAISSIDW